MLVMCNGNHVFVAFYKSQLQDNTRNGTNKLTETESLAFHPLMMHEFPNPTEPKTLSVHA